jgi:hypothetical protein
MGRFQLLSHAKKNISFASRFEKMDSRILMMKVLWSFGNYFLENVKNVKAKIIIITKI